ncbi:TNT domain-containing protein [Aspergillus novofumigatus IBT 16806]|uniref:TNT domain-containing protein n=1 Tax=Aspergillus novofumigatus (strain IBT 16806) TaxID=1392255 RepID=A0A2I1CEC1_ASPN1|nr:uncharacterized protein P174DRAFT_459457 [Aspergillus novofumigatus IBT 16806]PKX95966.1 hypothetical protein P174DRAFT_459457 [Aspergillus novofumigatus IBT 16806]
MQAEDYPATCGTNACYQLAYDCSSCICSNKLLGPANFTLQVPELAPIFNNYKALDAQCPKDWLCTWTNFTAANGKGSYVYPPNNGFKGCPSSGSPSVGDIVDRIGSPYGGYLAPRLTPFEKRSIPGVIKTLSALEGEILPWFGQPGGGKQWYIPGGLKPLINDSLVHVKPVLDSTGDITWQEFSDAEESEAASLGIEGDYDDMYH